MQRRRRFEFDTEADFAVALSAWFRAQGWTVYPELDGVDLVVVRADASVPEGRRVICVEVKLDLTFRGLEQAYEARALGHEAWSVICRAPSTSVAPLRLMAQGLGIGLYRFEKRFGAYNAETQSFPFDLAQVPVASAVPAPRIRNPRLLALMVPEAETWTVPGRPAPRRFTPFRLEEVKYAAWVRDNPGKTVEELLAATAPPPRNKRTGLPRQVSKAAQNRIYELLEKGAFTRFELIGDRLYCSSDRSNDVQSEVV
jgi:hypothetical protein